MAKRKSEELTKRPCDEGPASITAFIDDMNAQYEKVHVGFEDDFWATKMNLEGASVESLNSTKKTYEAFLRDKKNLAAVREQLGHPDVSEGQKAVLRIMERTFLSYIFESDDAVAIREATGELESKLEHARAQMKLGYEHPTDGFKEASSVLLRTTMTTADDEAVRKACHAGLRSIGTFIAPQFVEIIKLRNKLAHKLGYVDYYDYKVRQAEGFSKERLFGILEPLEQRTRQLMLDARAQLEKEGPRGLGAAATAAWNQSFALAGESAAAADPYFPFSEAVPRWASTFAALGIEYKQATMRLDLCDRKGKYSNGFCHWPQPAFRSAGGRWTASRANFTSLATPGAVGSGQTALATLLHEGGHAAHFANIEQDSPFFSQERAPTSVAYAENQSMFLDKLIGDASWIGRYAEDVAGNVMPWDLIEAKIRSSHAYRVFSLRSMIAVPFFEKALYELPEDQLTAERVQSIADEVEERICGGQSPRPLLSVPHVISDEASCYYHGYVLADMSVYQTRKHCFERFGEDGIVDNPLVGQRLSEVYWAPGNSVGFLDLVRRMTGSDLTADAWVEALQTPLAEHLAAEKKAYDNAVAVRATRKAAGKGGEDKLQQLNMKLLLVHGDEVIADSSIPEHGGFDGCCDRYRTWINSLK